MSDLTKLLADLEAATEGSQGLEFKIAVAVDWHENGVSIREFQAKLRWGHASHWQFPQWTRSLDAARTLIPEGLCWEVEGGPKTGGVAVIGTVNGPMEGIAATPELALCIACLHARTAQND